MSESVVKYFKKSVDAGVDMLLLQLVADDLDAIKKVTKYLNDVNTTAFVGSLNKLNRNKKNLNRNGVMPPKWNERVDLLVNIDVNVNKLYLLFDKQMAISDVECVRGDANEMLFVIYKNMMKLMDSDDRLDNFAATIILDHLGNVLCKYPMNDVN